MVKDLLDNLFMIKNFYECDGIKVYYNDKENYCIKLIKDGNISKVIRTCKDKSFKNFDMKKKGIENNESK